MKKEFNLMLGGRDLIYSLSCARSLMALMITVVFFSPASAQISCRDNSVAESIEKSESIYLARVINIAAIISGDGSRKKPSKLRKITKFSESTRDAVISINVMETLRGRPLPKSPKAQFLAVPYVSIGNTYEIKPGRMYLLYLSEDRDTDSFFVQENMAVGEVRLRLSGRPPFCAVRPPCEVVTGSSCELDETRRVIQSIK